MCDPDHAVTEVGQQELPMSADRFDPLPEQPPCEIISVVLPTDHTGPPHHHGRDLGTFQHWYETATSRLDFG
jgi:hypothetical protein